MYITTHSGEKGEDHVHLTLEHGPRAGTWEVRHEQGAVWRVRTPEGRVLLLKATEPWTGELRVELDDLMRRIAPRAVIEAMRRERASKEEMAPEAYVVEAVAA